MAIGTVLVPVGLLWWGWSGEAKIHWIMPNLGSLIFTTGVYICSGSVSVYTIDAYTQYAASAVSTNLVLRSLTAAVFPLFAPYMFDALGFGLGATALAGGFAIIGTAVVFICGYMVAGLGQTFLIVQQAVQTSMCVSVTACIEDGPSIPMFSERLPKCSRFR